MGTNETWALVFVSDTDITSGSVYAHPQVISIASTATVNKFKAFAFPQSKEPVFATVEHIFHENCSLIADIIPVFFTASGLWLLLGLAYSYWTFVLKKRHTLMLQKMLTLVPFCRCMITLVQGFEYNSCPWIDPNSPEKYLEMAQVSLVTISQTVILALLYSIAQGWNIVLFQLTRDQATYLTMIMGATYLTYSAYFLSSDFQSVRGFMNFLMGALYLGLLAGAGKHIVSNLKVIAHAQNLPDNEAYAGALALKRKMYKSYGRLLVVYLLVKVVFFMIINTAGDEITMIQFFGFLELLDVGLIGGILFLLRSREWPQFFTLSL